MYQAGFWKYFDSIQLDSVKLTIRVGLDMDKLEQNPEYVQQLYKMINRFLDFDFVFYDFCDIQNANLIILRGAFAVQYAMSNNPPRFTMCTYIFDESTVWDIYEKFSFTGTEKEPLISVSSSLGMDEMGYRTAFYAANSFFFFLTNGFEFLLPHEVFESIIREVSPEQAFSVQRLCVTWEEIVNAAEIEFITTTSSLMRYLETGYIYLTDVEYSLTAEERKEHIQTVLETMQINPHIVIGVLPSFGGDSTYKGENVSFYSNYKTGFLKKNKKYIHNQASPFLPHRQPPAPLYLPQVFPELKGPERIPSVYAGAAEPKIRPVQAPHRADLILEITIYTCKYGIGIQTQCYCMYKPFFMSYVFPAHPRLRLPAPRTAAERLRFRPGREYTA